MKKREWIITSRKEWLKDMPDLIYKLTDEYGFYYNKSYNRIKDIDKILDKNEKIRGRINVYVLETETTQIWYLVCYTKNFIKIHKCTEYCVGENWANVKRFITKFTKAYELAKNERFEREIRNV